MKSGPPDTSDLSDRICGGIGIHNRSRRISVRRRCIRISHALLFVCVCVCVFSKYFRFNREKNKEKMSVFGNAERFGLIRNISFALCKSWGECIVWRNSDIPSQRIHLIRVEGSKRKERKKCVNENCTIGHTYASHKCSSNIYQASYGRSLV